MRSDVDLKTGADFFSWYRGPDELGGKNTQWVSINQTSLSLDGAKQECQRLFGSGVLYQPHATEFRISRADHSTVLVAKPPHRETLKWRKFSI